MSLVVLACESLYRYALCASGVVNSRGSVWKSLCAVYKLSYVWNCNFGSSWVQKLRSRLMKCRGVKMVALNPGVGQKRALRALRTARSSTFDVLFFFF